MIMHSCKFFIQQVFFEELLCARYYLIHWRFIYEQIKCLTLIWGDTDGKWIKKESVFNEVWQEHVHMFKKLWNGQCTCGVSNRAILDIVGKQRVQDLENIGRLWLKDGKTFEDFNQGMTLSNLHFFCKGKYNFFFKLR